MSFIQTISQCCSRWFVDNSFNFQTCDFSGFFGGLSLAVVEVSWNCNYRSCYFLTKIIFCRFFHFLQNHCRNFLRRVFSVVNFHFHRVIRSCNHFVSHSSDFGSIVFKVRSNKSFDRIYRILRIGYRLSFCRISYQSFSVFRECHNRWRCSFSFCVRDNNRVFTLHYGNTRVGCS